MECWTYPNSGKANLLIQLRNFDSIKRENVLTVWILSKGQIQLYFDYYDLMINEFLFLYQKYQKHQNKPPDGGL